MAAPGEEQPSSGSVQSVDRALTILDLLAAEGELGVTDVGRLLGVHKSTASRLMTTLEAHGLVEQLPDRGRYRLGVGVLRLAGATRERLDVVRESRAITRALAGELDETVNIVILAGAETLYLDQAAGTSAVQIHNWVGHRNPLHATANGKVLLANTGPTERTALLAAAADRTGRLSRHTPRTVIDQLALTAELDQVAIQGFASAVDELEVGLTAVAAPVRGPDGVVIASMSVSGPTFRLTGTRLDRATSRLLDAAAAVSTRMGHLASPIAGDGR